MNKSKALLLKINKVLLTCRPYPSIMHNTCMSIDECVCLHVYLYIYGIECIYIYVCICMCV